jgi:hypothetical protein
MDTFCTSHLRNECPTLNIEIKLQEKVYLEQVSPFNIAMLLQTPYSVNSSSTFPLNIDIGVNCGVTEILS